MTAQYKVVHGGVFSIEDDLNEAAQDGYRIVSACTGFQLVNGTGASEVTVIMHREIEDESDVEDGEIEAVLSADEPDVLIY